MALWFGKKKEEPVKQEVRYVTKRVGMRYSNGNYAQKATDIVSSAMQSVDEFVNKELLRMRASSRDAFFTNPYGKKFVESVKKNVAGQSGIVFQSEAQMVNGNSYDEARNVIEEAFAKFCKKGNIDVSKTLSMVTFQHGALSNLVVDGEIFYKFVVTNNGLKIQMIDANSIPVDYSDSNYSTDTFVRFGIRFKKSTEEVVSYFVRSDTGKHIMSYSRGKLVEVPASEMVHVFVREMIGQKRGLPFMGRSLPTMQHLGEYRKAALVAARIGASKMGFYTTPTGAEYVGDEEDEQGNLIQEVEAGVFEELPSGYDFKTFDADYPHQQFESFIKSSMRDIAAGLSVSYNDFSDDMETVNFSSLRGSVIEARETWKLLQNFFVDEALRPMFEKWLIHEITTGELRVRGKPLLMSNFDRYNKAKFIPRRWQWVDPLKDANASKVEVDAGFRSLSEIIREKGREPEEVFAEMQRERELLAKYGITLGEVVSKMEDNNNED